MKNSIEQVLKGSMFANRPPVLVDVGASGAPPSVWRPIARHSLYVGFDPDARDFHETDDGGFARRIVINKAVVSAPAIATDVFLTSFPHCSSTLPPDRDALQHYLFSNLFAVEQTVNVSATTLPEIISELNLSNFDWLKLDTQGTDLRLFNSLPAPQRDRLLAVDVEPGFIDAYIGEDLFIDSHRAIISEGFWLSRLEVLGNIRLRRDTLAHILHRDARLSEKKVAAAVRPSPCWCEARYLRTVESLAERNCGERDYLLLWIFALLDEQFGFALDLAAAYAQKFPGRAISRQLMEAPSHLIKRRHRWSVWTRPVAALFRRLRALKHVMANG